MQTKSHIWLSPASGRICARLLALQAEALVPCRLAMRFHRLPNLAKRRDEVRRLSGIVASLYTSLEGTPWADDAAASRSRVSKAHRAISAEIARRMK
jgi:hypothetical protein